MKRYIIPLVCLLIALHHLVMEGLYLLPVNPLTPHYIRYVGTYMDPLFQQRWQLFAPDPVLYSLQLWYRCGDSGGAETSWFDPVAPLMHTHQINRITSKGKLADLYQSIAREYLNDYLRNIDRCDDDVSESMECEQSARRSALKSPYGLAAQKGAIMECDQSVRLGELRNVAWIQFQTVKVYPKQFSERHSDKLASRIEYFQSDKILLQNMAKVGVP